MTSTAGHRHDGHRHREDDAQPSISGPTAVIVGLLLRPAQAAKAAALPELGPLAGRPG